MSSTERLSLPQLRTQAKELLRAIRVADSEAQKRALAYFGPETEFILANAQLVVARENGYSSWASLKRALERPTIFEAIEDGNVNQVAALLAESPELSSSWRKTSHGGWESALHVCAGQGSVEIARLLIEHGAEIYAVRQSGYPPVDRAHYGKQPAMVEFLLEASAKSDHGHPPTYGVGIDIVLASRIGWLDRVRMHVERDPFAVYRRGCIGESVLHWPAHNGHAEILTYLLDHNAVIDADEIGLYGGKPIHWAAEHSPVTLEILIQRGANPNARNLIPGEFESYTPLHMCARQREQCIECAELLLAAGADPNLIDAEGRTPLDIAQLNGRDKMQTFLERLPAS